MQDLTLVPGFCRVGDWTDLFRERLVIAIFSGTPFCRMAFSK